MPIYYRNKIYTEDEREQLWLEKLDKETRYILGQPISISNGNLNEYRKALRYAQKHNKKLGYGDNMATWEEEQYEKQQRQLMIEKRIKNASGGSCADRGFMVEIRDAGAETQD